MLGRLIVATRTTLLVALPVVLISLVIGSLVGMWAGYHRGRRETMAMRVADVIMSFPSLLLAVVVLYIFSPSIANIVLILTITRIPVYLRTARAESAELQSRLFVDAARTFGTPARAIIRRHVFPVVLPTLLTVATLDFCYVMLAESSLSFLGIGIQPPDVSWGLMVAQARTSCAPVVAVGPARPGHRDHHGLGQPAGLLGPDRHRPGPALAADHRPQASPAPHQCDGDPMTAAPLTATAEVGLEVTGLTVELHTPRGDVRAVDEVSFTAYRGQTLALLGESGCGKSMTAQAVAGLLEPIAEVTGGRVVLGDEDLLTVSRKRRRQVAGPLLSIVFQDALTALNPVYTVGTQLAEPFRIHQKMSAKAARVKAIELMGHVGIPEPESRVDSYPHQFSGGMRQRLLIAMAVALSPKVLIADEPTTALDVTVQAQILALLARLRAEHEMAVVLITHDLAVVAEEADRVAVMYAGRIVESGRVSEVFEDPRHPYTRGLLESVPVDAERGADLRSIPGSPPDLFSIPQLRVSSEMPSGPRYLPPGATAAAVTRPGGRFRPAGLRLSLRRGGLRCPTLCSRSPGSARRSTWPSPNGNDRLRALDRIDLTLGRGETLALVGESGCGKSTLARTLMLLERPDEGTVRYRGVDPFALRGKELLTWRRRVQMVFQDRTPR